MDKITQELLKKAHESYDKTPDGWRFDSGEDITIALLEQLKRIADALESSAPPVREAYEQTVKNVLERMDFQNGRIEAVESFSNRLVRLEEALGMQSKVIVIEYEVPPMRGIMRRQFLDDGQSEQEIREAFLAEHQRARIRNITWELAFQDEEETEDLGMRKHENDL